MRTAFIGNRNDFDLYLCDWLKEVSDFQLAIWTSKLSWASSVDGDRYKRVLRRFRHRAKRRGTFRTLNEAAYYALYRRFVARRDQAAIRMALDEAESRLVGDRSRDYAETMPESIHDESIIHQLAEHDVQVMVAMCVDVFLPNEVHSAPEHGTLLIHEGFLPEYRGVYSPFWTLLNRDYERLGYSIIQMTDRLDAGSIYSIGAAREIDTKRDWHGYVGHKAVIDSLPELHRILSELEAGTLVPLSRSGAQEAYYSYPTATALGRLALGRITSR